MSAEEGTRRLRRRCEARADGGSEGPQQDGGSGSSGSRTSEEEEEEELVLHHPRRRVQVDYAALHLSMFGNSVPEEGLEEEDEMYSPTKERF